MDASILFTVQEIIYGIDWKKHFLWNQKQVQIFQSRKEPWK